jgi:hypothetical protein
MRRRLIGQAQSLLCATHRRLHHQVTLSLLQLLLELTFPGIHWVMVSLSMLFSSTTGTPSAHSSILLALRLQDFPRTSTRLPQESTTLSPCKAGTSMAVAFLVSVAVSLLVMEPLLHLPTSRSPRLTVLISKWPGAALLQLLATDFGIAISTSQAACSLLTIPPQLPLTGASLICFQVSGTTSSVSVPSTANWNQDCRLV